MAEANAQIGRVFDPTDPRSAAMGADRNLRDGHWDANMFRRPDHWVYIYTVSDRSFTVSQPPLFRSLIIPARKAGERCSFVCKLPHPFNQVDREGAIGDLMVRAHDAERVAMSLVNPNNTSLDQDARTPDGSVLGLGVNLNLQGVFWSLNSPPTEAEIMKAEGRRESYYTSLLEQARTLEISNPKELEHLLNQDFHQAAEYYGIETSWHKKMIKRETCPLCGEDIKPGIAFHKNTSGTICVLDEKRARKAGVTVSSSGGE